METEIESQTRDVTNEFSALENDECEDGSVCSHSVGSATSKTSLNSDEDPGTFSEDPGNDEDDSSDTTSVVGSPENCVYFLTSPPGKILYINANTNSLHEFPPIVKKGEERTGDENDDEGSEQETPPDEDVEVVAISAERSSLWALSKDGSLYVYVFSSGARIRRLVHTYENQRYRLIYGGWTHKLMRVDRYPWSSRGGQKFLPKSSFNLLNETCWKWDGQWRLAEIMDNQPTEKDGWLYATNFTQSQYGTQGNLSFVRRRKWIRYMSYSKISQWTQVDSSGNPGNIPAFVLLGVGGSSLSGCTPGHLSVWAVGTDDQIFFREGITASRPEGEKWRVIEGTSQSVVQIVVSPTGHTWVLNWAGTICIRAGISSKTPWGTKWVNIVSQHPETVPRFQCVSLGEKTAWAVSAGCQKVYFLPNVEAKLIDYKWIEVVGNMYGIFVGLNNQVWAVSLQNRSTVFFREKVTSKELSGKAWKILKLDFNDIVSCRMSQENLSFKDSEVNIRQVSATSFDWGGKGSRTVPLHWFMKIPNFKPPSEVRQEILTSFHQRNDWEIKCFENVAEFVESKKGIDAHQCSALSFSSELQCNLTLSSHKTLKISNSFSSCLISLETFQNLESSTEVFETKLVFNFASTTVEIMLSNIVYVRHILNHDRPTLILTTNELWSKQLYFSILFDTYKEMFNWWDTVQQARKEVLRNYSSNNIVNSVEMNSGFIDPVQSSNLFCIDELGYCFTQNYNESRSAKDVKTDYWSLLKGHFEKIVSDGELTVALNADHSVWFYRGSLTSASGFSESVENAAIHTDFLTVSVEEFESWSLPFGFHGKYFSVNPPTFSNDRKSKQVSEDDLSFVQLPSTLWEWTSEKWSIDYSNCDHKGWSYTTDISNPSSFHAEPSRGDNYRRRIHKRTCAISQKSCWHLLTSKPALKDVTMPCKTSTRRTTNCFHRQEVAKTDHQFSDHNLWGLGLDGSLYQGCVAESLKDEALEKNSNGLRSIDFYWKQIVNDYTLLSISSAQYHGGPILWGICSDGITLLLHYRSYSIPIDGPPVVPPPHKQSCLQKVDCGGNRTLTVVLDCYNMAWIREGASWDYPEGTSWSKLASGVTDISVDLDSNVWVVLESYNGQSGVVAQLRNKCNRNPDSTAEPKSPSHLKHLLYHKDFTPIIRVGPRIKHISAKSFYQPNFLETT